MDSNSAHVGAGTPQPARAEFTRAQCDDLFAAILVNDKVDLGAQLPEPMHVDCAQTTLIECYRLCRQLWYEGADRRSLARIVDAVGRRGDLDAHERLVFKHVRAKFKHLRFGYAVFGASHRYPRMFHAITATMGGLQDAFKNGRRGATLGFALLLRLLLLPPFYRIARREVDAFEPTAHGAFHRYLGDGMDTIAEYLGRDAVSAHEFHQMRKIISRESALYCDLKILVSPQDYAAISRYVDSLNGLMGSLHDELVEQHFNKEQHYRADAFVIPAPIRDRLAALIRWHRAGRIAAPCTEPG